MPEVCYNYKDILLVPNYSDLDSRSEADTSVQFGPRRFALPICISNMKTVIDEKLAEWCAKPENNYFYILHRFGIDPVQFCENMISKGLFTSISLGVNEDSYKQISDLIDRNISPDYITIDIAHGWSKKMRVMLAHLNELRAKYSWFKPFILGGNTVSPDAVSALEQWGCDAQKIGVGPGSVCSTRVQTGFSFGQFSAVLECSKVATKPILADGGIETTGCLAKSLVAGSTMSVAAGIFAGHDESPGRTIIQIENGQEVKYKEFFGSASEHNKGEKKHIEGRRILVPYRGPIADKFTEIKQNLQSSISYAGGRDLSCFSKVKWVVVN